MNHSKQNSDSTTNYPDDQDKLFLEWLIPAAVRLFDETKQFNS